MLELQEVKVDSEGKPLLHDNASSGGAISVPSPYIANGMTCMADLQVTVQGTRGKRPFVTFHDIGMNHVSNFSALFGSESMQPILDRFCIYHIDAPGMEENAPDLTQDFVYPSIESLSDMVPKVFTKFGIKGAICMGCGLGANVLMRFAMKNPSLVDGLILVNVTRGTVGYFPWISGKLTNFTTPLTEQLLNHHFSKAEVEHANRELVESHRRYLNNKMNCNNIALLLREYERRTEINVFRSLDPNDPDSAKHTLSCSTLLLVGDMSPFVEDVVEVNSRLSPADTTLLKMADAGGMILEEQTFKVCEAIIFYLQGLGYMPSVVMSRLARSRTLSGCSSDGDKQRVRTLSGNSVDHACGDNKTVSEPIVEEISPENVIVTDKAQLVAEGVC